jgi:hypothetical protein
VTDRLVWVIRGMPGVSRDRAMDELLVFVAGYHHDVVIWLAGHDDHAIVPALTG